MSTLALTPPALLANALAPSPWLQLAAGGTIVSIVGHIDEHVSAAVDAERTPIAPTRIAPSPGDTPARDASFQRTDDEPRHMSPVDEADEAEERQSITSSRAAALALQSAERERAINDPDNQEGGYLPCIAGDTVGDARYTLLKELGRGESSKVWLARITPESLGAQQAALSEQNASADTSAEDLRMRSSPAKRPTDASQVVAIKIYRCEERLEESMDYERALMAFITRRCAEAADRRRAAAAKAARKAGKAPGSPDRSLASTSNPASLNASTASMSLPSIAEDSGGADVGICRLRDQFVHTGPFGQHPCLVFDVLGPPVDWLMKEFDFQGIPYKTIVVDVLRSTLQTLVLLDSLHVIHTDLKPENLLFVKPQAELANMLDHLDADPAAADDLAAQAAEAGPCAAPFAVRFIDFGLSYVVPPELRSTVTVHNHGATGSPSRARTTTTTGAVSSEERELLHLGNYQKGATIQTREYRAPEIILGTNFNTKADVWSLGCMAYELVTGQFLFDPKSHPDAVDEAAMDERHLYEISTVIGHPPLSWLDRGRGVHTRSFFDARAWKFLGQRPLRRSASRNIVEDLLPFVARYQPDAQCRAEAEALADFILRCVQWDPSKRATAAELLQHPWLQARRPAAAQADEDPES